MLKVNHLFQYQLLLILKNTFELAKNTISKSLIVFKVFLEKYLKLFSCYSIFGFKVTFLLMLLLNYCFVKTQGSKKDFIQPIGSKNFEIILTLLIKTIAIKV